MVTSSQALHKYGPPHDETRMVMWDVPHELELGAIPNRIYCNKDMIAPLTQAFKNIRDRGLGDQVKTWDGCFNIRLKRGSTNVSLHSWGIAIDINAAWNRFRSKPTMGFELVKAFTDAGFEWGGDWSQPDGMHFQLKSLP